MKKEIMITVLGFLVFSLNAAAQQSGSPLVKVRIKNGRIVSWENSVTAPVSTQIQEENNSPIGHDLPEDGTYARIDPGQVNPSGSMLLADLVGSIGVNDGLGPDISYGYTLMNGGSSRASGFHVYIVLSSDMTITPDDILVADNTHTLNPMNLYTSGTRQADVGQISAGTYYLGIYVDATYLIAESDEDNNASYDDSPRVIVAALPDLEVKEFSLTNIEANSNRISVSLRITNRGNVNANLSLSNVIFGLYLSPDQTIGKESDYLYARLSSNIILQPGDYVWHDYQPWRSGECDGIIQGEYYLGVYLDINEIIRESREFNNAAVETEPRVSVPPQLPDLMWLNLETKLFGYGFSFDSLYFAPYVDNGGWDGVTGSFKCRAILSSDQSIDDSDRLLGEMTYSEIIVDRSSSDYIIFPPVSTADIPAGNYYVLFEADAENTIDEISESNNILVCTYAVNIVHLCITYPNGGETWEKGKSYTIEWTTDGTLSEVFLALYKNGESLSYIAQNVTNTNSYVYTLPTDLEDGDDYQIRISDDFWPYKTSDFSDTYFSIQTPEPPTPKPDLVIQTLEVLDGEGPEIRYQCIVKNSGNGASGQSKVKFYLSYDTQINESDYLIDTWIVTGTLSAGSSLSSGERTTTVTGVAAGEYYLGAIADADKQVSESSEGNNIRYDDSPRVTIPEPSGRHWADIDGDGDVDIIDVQMVAGRWGCEAGDNDYLTICDVDGDGDIDVVDVQMVSGLWGTVF